MVNRLARYLSTRKLDFSLARGKPDSLLDLLDALEPVLGNRTTRQLRSALTEAMRFNNRRTHYLMFFTSPTLHRRSARMRIARWAAACSRQRGWWRRKITVIPCASGMVLEELRAIVKGSS